MRLASPDSALRSELGALTVRNAGSVIMLIGCGYEREALVPARVLVECSIRIQQLNDDTSGAVARQVLKGQRPRALKTVARRYGIEREVEVLDRFAHADVLTLRLISDYLAHDPGDRTLNIELRPLRGHLRPASQLLLSARASAHLWTAWDRRFQTVISGNAAGGLTIQPADRRVRSYLLGLGCDVG